VECADRRICSLRPCRRSPPMLPTDR
jgi:hypothetical protein